MAGAHGLPPDDHDDHLPTQRQIVDNFAGADPDDDGGIAGPCWGLVVEIADLLRDWPEHRQPCINELLDEAASYALQTVGLCDVDDRGRIWVRGPVDAQASAHTKCRCVKQHHRPHRQHLDDQMP